MATVPFLLALFIVAFVCFVSKLFTKDLNHTNVSWLESPPLFQQPYSSQHFFILFQNFSQNLKTIQMFLNQSHLYFFNCLIHPGICSFISKIFTDPLHHTNISWLESPLLFQLPYSSRRLFVSFRACHLVRSHRQHTVRVIAHNGFELFYKELVHSGNPHLTFTITMVLDLNAVFSFNIGRPYFAAQTTNVVQTLE